MLGLKFPCGPQLEQLALNNTEKFKVRPTLKGADCCLSGLENQCKKCLITAKAKKKLLLFAFAFIQATLEKMTEKLLEQFGNLPVIFAGGVMSNSIIRNALTEKFGATFAKPEYSADNAAGIAYLAYKKYTEI